MVTYPVDQESGAFEAQPGTPSRVSREAVQEAIEKRLYRTVFPQDLERAYQDNLSRYRRRLCYALLPPSLITYNAFLLVDYLLVPEVFWVSVAIHLLVVSPIIVLSSLVVARIRNGLVADCAAIVVPVAIVLQIMTIFLASDAPISIDYHYLSIMIIVFMNVIYKIRHDRSRAATILLSTLYLTMLFQKGVDYEVLLVASTMTIAAGYLTLSANWRMACDARFSFLHRTKDRMSREAAESEAVHDPLTGLANRRGLESRFPAFYRIGGSPPRDLAVVMMDIDHFKEFNDRYGHIEGDICLKRVGRLLQWHERAGVDLAVRFGGEEFLFLKPVAGWAEARAHAETLRSAVEAMEIENATVASKRLTASFGVALASGSGWRSDQLVGAADRALYRAKLAGRNRVVTASADPGDGAQAPAGGRDAL